MNWDLCILIGNNVGPDKKRERRERYKRGRRAELWATIWLKLKGYRILARRHRTPVGEIDIIVRKRGKVSFIEVKRRKTITEAESALPHNQRKRIARAALHWLDKNKKYETHEMSLDVVLMVPRKMPVHIIGAFEPDT